MAGPRSPRIPNVAAEMLRAGLRLWRGPPFSGLDDSGVLLAERTRLVELQLLALEDRVAAELASGRHREVAAELDALVPPAPVSRGAARSAHGGVVPIGPPGRGAARRSSRHGRSSWTNWGSTRRHCCASWRSRSSCRTQHSIWLPRAAQHRRMRAGRGATRSSVCAPSPRPTPTTSTVGMS